MLDWVACTSVWIYSRPRASSAIRAGPERGVTRAFARRFGRSDREHAAFLGAIEPRRR
jgi:hypothetical protein